MATNVLAVDIGSSSVRAFLYDETGRQVPGVAARQEWEMLVGGDGSVEGDADELLESVFHCIDIALEQANGRGAQIGAVAASTFVSNILVVDPEGRAISPIFPYSDTRPIAEAEDLRRILDEAAVHQRTGCRFHPSYLPARVAWLKRVHPDLWKPGMRLMTAGEYLALKVFGHSAVSVSAASWSGLLNRVRLEWDAELLEALALDQEALSPLVDFDEPFQGLLPPFAERWPQLVEAPWYPAMGDGAMANLGSGCLDPGRVCLTIGTSSAMRSTLPEQVDHIPPALWCYRVDRHRSLMGGALNEGGNVFAWLKRSLRLDTDAVERELATRPPDGHGLAFLPTLVGERSPGWDASRRGTLHGLSLASTPLDILQAGLEGVAYRLGLVYRQLRPALPADPEIVAAGAALLSSPAWLQIMADVLGKTIRVGPGKEASSRGAARLAFQALGQDQEWEDEPQTEEEQDRVYEPDPARHEVFRKAIERQQALYEILGRV